VLARSTPSRVPVLPKPEASARGHRISPVPVRPTAFSPLSPLSLLLVSYPRRIMQWASPGQVVAFLRRISWPTSSQMAMAPFFCNPNILGRGPSPKIYSI